MHIDKENEHIRGFRVYLNNVQRFNGLRASEAYMRLLTRSSLVQAFTFVFSAPRDYLDQCWFNVN